jgi:hypothetical protein
MFVIDDSGPPFDGGPLVAVKHKYDLDGQF